MWKKRSRKINQTAKKREKLNIDLGTWLKKYDLFFIRFCLDGPNY